MWESKYSLKKFLHPRMADFIKQDRNDNRHREVKQQFAEAENQRV